MSSSRRAAVGIVMRLRDTDEIEGDEEPMKALKKQVKIDRPKKEEVSREEALKRVKAFPKRKEKLIAAIREGARRGLHS